MKSRHFRLLLFFQLISSIFLTSTVPTNETKGIAPIIISRGMFFLNSSLLSSSLEIISSNAGVSNSSTTASPPETSAKFNSSLVASVAVPAVATNNSARYSFITVGKPVDTSAFLSADDQCKLMHGKQATFCRSNIFSICQSLSCRLSLNDTCVDAPVGARDGTICAPGKICMQGVCTESERAPYGDCLFGDDLVFQEAIGMSLPSAQMTCDAVLKFVDSLNQSPTAYCSNSNFRQICCQTCKKYDRLECTDKYFDCPRYRKVCKTSSINGVSLNILCPRTCGRCAAKPLQCSSEKELCQNGGTCVNLTVPEENLFGFRCHCAIGYYGDLCEKKNSCLPNPCRMDETCESFGTIAYKCMKATVSTANNNNSNNNKTPQQQQQQQQQDSNASQQQYVPQQQQQPQQQQPFQPASTYQQPPQQYHSSTYYTPLQSQQPFTQQPQQPFTQQSQQPFTQQSAQTQQSTNQTSSSSTTTTSATTPTTATTSSTPTTASTTVSRKPAPPVRFEQAQQPPMQPLRPIQMKPNLLVNSSSFFPFDRKRPPPSNVYTTRRYPQPSLSSSPYSSPPPPSALLTPSQPQPPPVPATNITWSNSPSDFSWTFNNSPPPPTSSSTTSSVTNPASFSPLSSTQFVSNKMPSGGKGNSSINSGSQQPGNTTQSPTFQSSSNGPSFNFTTPSVGHTNVTNSSFGSMVGGGHPNDNDSSGHYGNNTGNPLLKIMQLNPALQNVFDCVNYNDDVCNYYASKNLCDPYYYLNGESIAIKCPKACQKC